MKSSQAHLVRSGGICVGQHKLCLYFEMKLTTEYFSAPSLSIAASLHTHCSGPFSCCALTSQWSICCLYPWPGLPVIPQACKILSVSNDYSSAERKLGGSKYAEITSQSWPDRKGLYLRWSSFSLILLPMEKLHFFNIRGPKTSMTLNLPSHFWPCEFSLLWIQS